MPALYIVVHFMNYLHLLPFVAHLWLELGLHVAHIRDITVQFICFSALAWYIDKCWYMCVPNRNSYFGGSAAIPLHPRITRGNVWGILPKCVNFWVHGWMESAALTAAQMLYVLYQCFDICDFGCVYVKLQMLHRSEQHRAHGHCCMLGLPFQVLARVCLSHLYHQ